MKVFKVHPAIGIIRVGDGEGWFVGPEQIGHPGVEIQTDGSETRVTAYKLDGKIKRQGARFRVWEYEVADNGSITSVGEVAANVRVEWSAKLVNSKAAAYKLTSLVVGDRRVLVPSSTLRNPLISDRGSLIIDGGTVSLAGPNVAAESFDSGSFLGQPVDLGEAFTDSAGRLIVLGGHGKSRGIPTTPGGMIPPLSYFHNNDRWYDDVSDGPITARVIEPGQPPVDAIPAWVICAPPDFAPPAGAPATLYDIAVQAAIDRNWVTPPALPSFVNDIKPILKRALSLRWVHDWFHWDAVSDDWQALADPANHPARLQAFNAIVDTSLHEYGLTSFILEILVKWRDGQFLGDVNSLSNPIVGAAALDRAALDACVATSFFPGIEAGYGLTNSSLYMEFGRLSHQQVAAGEVSSLMAVPWQADFNDCDSDWWPSQRPNDVFVNAASIPNSPVVWADGVYTANNAVSRLRMVEQFSKLGFIVADENGRLIETERSNDLPSR